MKCPKCHTELVKGLSREFETLTDHVCNPNQERYPLRAAYECKNIKCPASMDQIFWDEYGAMYGMNRGFEFENDLNSAYPSNERKMDVEISKKGLKSNLRLHPCFMLWFLQPMIEFTYKADDYGNVLKKGYKLIWLKKDSWKPWVKDRFGYHTHYSFPVMNIIHHIQNEIYVIRKCSDKHKEYRFNNDLFKPLPNWDKRWWRRVEKSIDKVIYYKQYLKFKNNYE